MGVNPSQAKTSLKYFVVNNAKQVPRNVNTTTPSQAHHKLHDYVETSAPKTHTL